MKTKHLELSVCIPTFNRANFLNDCLESIVFQLQNPKVKNKVEIIISDNASSDNTEKIVKSYSSKFPDIRYFRNKKNIGGDLNIIKAASYARGDYIWFFADDDLHYNDSLETVLKISKKYSPDTINVNLDLVSKDGTRIVSKNLLMLNRDVIVRSKKELFRFLENKFFLPIDWYTTCMSNTIVTRNIFNRNLKKVMSHYDADSNNFLHTGLIYYNKEGYKMYFISKALAKFRMDNRRMTGPDENTQRSKYFEFLYRVFNKHNDMIYKINKNNMSLKFKSLLLAKHLSRDLRRVLLNTLNFDISNLLINLFQKKN